MDEARQNKLFCFDIETVIDIETAKRHLSLPDSTPDSDVEQALIRYHLNLTDGKNSFFRQPFWKVVCVSYLECAISYGPEGESYSIISVKSGGAENSGEKEIISAMFNYLNKERPRLVSFNGRTFDLPVLKYRSMLHKIPAPWFYRTGTKWSSYGNRYSLDWHCDLLDAVSDFGASARVKMSEVASLLGISCKLDVDGSEVATLYNKGKIKQIRQYCEQDCLCTFLIYLYFSLHQSRISQLSFDKSLESLENYIAKQKAAGVDVGHIENFYSNLKL